MKAETISNVEPVPNRPPAAAGSGGPGQPRAILNRLGPFFGLVLVFALFAALLAAKDLLDQHAALTAAANPATADASWWKSVGACSFDGFKAFISMANLKTVLAQTVIVGIGALGMTMIIISGGIDLSVGSSVALTSVLGATLLVKGWPALLVVLITICAGGLIGLVNGTIIASLRMMPFIVTLGMMGVARGVAKWVAGNQTVNAPANSSVNNLMKMEDLDHFLPLPMGVWIALALALTMMVMMRQTVFGRYIFAIGSNEATARLCGIRVPLQKVFIYSLGGGFFGASGLMQMTRLTQGDPSGAVGLELDMIAAVVIGGASLSGGTGSVLGSVVGALIIQVLRNGSSLMNWPTFTQEIIIGAVIILAVGLDKLRQRKG